MNGPGPQSAAAPSPFPPIADYAFLSDCHTGALVAPDGSIDWLCVPAFDAPSLFGSLLDREAGTFRFGPYGIHHPTTRAYGPGTMALTTTWKTPSGWVVVRDALTIGPSDHEDEVTPHTRPPTDDDADHVLVRIVECVEGRVEVELVCEPAFDYGREVATWTLARRRPPHGRCERGGPERGRPPPVGPRARDRGQPRPRPPRAGARRARFLCALVGRAPRRAAGRRRGPGDARRDEALLAPLARRSEDPRPSLARPDPTLGPRDQGPHLHADRRHRRRADHVAAGDPRRRAQLGLPLHLDA